MVREDKVKVVKDLEDLFKSANALVLAEYRGLTVTQQTKLRRELKNAGASFNVVKMSLACLLYTSPSPRDGLLSRMPSPA